MANEDRDYLTWLRWKPCLVCGRHPCQAHHPRHNVGMGQRAHDHRAVPLCYQHHEDVQQYRLDGMNREQLRDWMDAAAERLRKDYNRNQGDQ